MYGIWTLMLHRIFAECLCETSGCRLRACLFRMAFHETKFWHHLSVPFRSSFPESSSSLGLRSRSICRGPTIMFLLNYSRTRSWSIEAEKNKRLHVHFDKDVQVSVEPHWARRIPKTCTPAARPKMLTFVCIRQRRRHKKAT